MDAIAYQRYLLNRTIFTCVVIFSLISCSKNSPPDSSAIPKIQTRDGTVFLNQGWDTETRQRLSYISFGSRVLDYNWFIALEQAENELLFRDNTHMQNLGFITEPVNSFNPDGLALGISRDTDKNGASWMGITCAACHVGEVKINNQAVRIEGGQSLINYTKFETELLASLKATVEQPEKFQRFIGRLEKLHNNSSDNIIKKNLEARIHELEIRHAINATDVPYGHGRLDAFGQIFNAVTVEALKIPGNKHAPDAPTSFPMLWDASHLNIVQWNASAPNKTPGPLFQNATTAMAVYGTVNVLDHRVTYASSTDIINLGYIQSKFYQLTAPQWPEEFAGKLNKELRVTGQQLYAKNCAECHSVVSDADPKRKINAVLVPLEKIGTDPRMATNFTNAKVKTGELEGKRSLVFFGKKFGAEESAIDVVMHVTTGTLARHPIDTLRAIIEEYASQNAAPANNDPLVYKARPINGIWASAPYLHNGSVPTVYDLLLPVAQRPTQFYVGNRELDLQKVGNQISQVEGSSLFDTGLPGNSNSGHEFGIHLTEPERMALLEYIKGL